MEVKNYSFYYDLGGHYINWKFMFAIRLHETDNEYALIAINHCLEDAEVTIKFNSVQKIHHDAYKNNVLTLKLIQSDGMILSWKK